MPKKIILQKGQRIGTLTVIGYHHSKTHINNKSGAKREYDYYLCKCDCGKEKVVLRDSLISKNHTKSCGCIIKKRLYKLSFLHGLSNTRLFRIWAHIKDRCLNSKNDAYRNYGGRGITVCDEWKNDFMAFYNWAMANGYSEVLTIDRINNDGNYEPNNCRWVTAKEQHRNTRRNTFLLYKGERRCVSEWCELLRLNKETVLSRLRRGECAEKALRNYEQYQGYIESLFR